MKGNEILEYKIFENELRKDSNVVTLLITKENAIT